MVSRLRLVELYLLAPAGLLAFGGLALLGLVQQPPASSLWAFERPALIFVAALVAAYAVLVAANFRGDQVLLPVTAILAGLGMVLVRRLNPAVADRQLTWLVLGLAVMVATVLVLRDLDLLRRYRYVWALGGLLLVTLTLFFGQDTGGTGAALWLGFGGYYFQPSELLKILLVVYLASYLADNQDILAAGTYRVGPLRLPPLPHLAPLVVMWGVSMLLLIAQRDLGAAMLFFGIYLGMLYAASGQLGYVLAGLVPFAGGAWLAMRSISYVAARVAVWEDPWSQASGRGYQIVQALTALAAGGILGTGLGYGYPGYVPAVYTDYVVAAIGEEMGMAGLLVVIALYMLLVGRGFTIALRARDPFAQLLAGGLSTMLALQTLIIVAGSLKVIPLTGITLPFVSYGGSSLVTNLMVIGILLRISAGDAAARKADDHIPGPAPAG